MQEELNRVRENNREVEKLREEHAKTRAEQTELLRESLRLKSEDCATLGARCKQLE